MSKIFEALQKTGHITPGLERPSPPEHVEPPASTTEELVARIHAEPAIEPEPESDWAPAAAPVSAYAEPEPFAALGVGPRTEPVRLAAKDPVLPFDARSRRSVEQYRLIRTKIGHHPASPQIIAISSAGPGDGKTVTSINLAGAMSLKAGARILLIDGDLRRSSVARMLGLPREPGLTDVIAQSCTLDDALIRLEQFPNCVVLPAGRAVENPPELLDSPNWRAVCSTLRQRFQNVIFDTPPVAAVADYELIEAVCDGIVMVVRPDYTNRTAFKKAIAGIAPPKLLGLIVNDVQDWFLWKMQSGYPYTYYDELDAAHTKSASAKGRR